MIARIAKALSGVAAAAFTGVAIPSAQAIEELARLPISNVYATESGCDMARDVRQGGRADYGFAMLLPTGIAWWEGGCRFVDIRKVNEEAYLVDALCNDLDRYRPEVLAIATFLDNGFVGPEPRSFAVTSAGAPDAEPIYYHRCDLPVSPGTGSDEGPIRID